MKWYFSKYINFNQSQKFSYVVKIGISQDSGGLEFFSDFLDSEVTIFDRFVGLGRICKTSVNKSKVDSMDKLTHGQLEWFK